MVVPKNMQTQILRATHEKGHINAKSVATEVRKNYAIKRLEEKCKPIIAQCVPCILSSRKTGKQEGFLHTIDKGDSPLDTYHVDHLGPLPSTAKSYKYIFIVVDARGNGQVERINGIIIPALTKMSVENPLKWYQHVSQLQRFLNSNESRSTKKTPFELMFGVPMRNPEDQQLARAVEDAIQ